jgi:hypothetical protein
MSGRDDSFGWRATRRHDIRDTFGQRSPTVGGRSSPRPPAGRESVRPTPQRPAIPRTQKAPARQRGTVRADLSAGPPIRSNDIVLHKQHRVGVVIATSELECEVRYFGGKAWSDRARLKTILSAADATSFLSHVASDHKAKAPIVRGAALWLRSADASLRSIAVEIFSHASDPMVVAAAEEVLSHCTAQNRLRIASEISGARAALGLANWPETVTAAADWIAANPGAAAASRERCRAEEERALA